jgi:hypothetical protein
MVRQRREEGLLAQGTCRIAPAEAPAVGIQGRDAGRIREASTPRVQTTDAAKVKAPVHGPLGLVLTSPRPVSFDGR